MFSEDTGGYFCILFISLPRVYPTAKHEIALSFYDYQQNFSFVSSGRFAITTPVPLLRVFPIDHRNIYTETRYTPVKYDKIVGQFKPIWIQLAWF